MDIETALTFTDALVFAKVGTHLSDLQQAMLRSSWAMQRQSYDQIADHYGYSATYLKHDVGPKLWKLLSEVLGEKVNKTSFRTAIERRYQTDAISIPLPAEPETLPPPSQPLAPTSPRQDWGSAADVSLFYGRQAELDQLQNWIMQDRCRLVAVLGMGGMGKTSLSVKLAQQLIQSSSASTFQFVIWRSLRNAPPIQDLLTDLLHFFSNQQEVNYPETLEGKIGQLLNYLRSHRCLIILDNVETILQTAASDGENLSYRSGNEAYGELFRQIGETMHQSCLVITSREKPHEVAILEGATLPVRTLPLSGLPMDAGQKLLQLKGTFQASEAEWQRLIEGYSGNPLALKMISTTIQTLFNGSIADFLQQETLVFGTIRNLIEQQFERLSGSEKTVMYWLAINREPVSFGQLRSDIFPPLPPQTLMEVLETLEHRSLIEKTETLFSLQPAVMEYVTDCLVGRIVTEIQMELVAQSTGQQRPLCKSHTLLKSQAKDYIRETQIRFILKPILERLQLTDQGNSLQNTLMHILTSLSDKPKTEIGYAGGNLLNLLFQSQKQLQDCDLSRLVIWQADFLNIALQNVNLSNSNLEHSLFTETLGIVFTIAFNPDGTLFATGDAEGGLRLWQAADTKLLLNLEGHLGWVWAITFSPDGRTLASCSSDKTIRLWDIQTGECLQVLHGHQSAIWAVAFSADGEWLASGGDEPLIRLWQVTTGKLRRELFQTGRILSLAFSPTNSILASGGAEGTIRLWAYDTGDLCAVLGEHTNRIWSVGFSPDGQLLASGSADSTIKLWQIETKTCLHSLHDHRDRVRSVSFSPDGHTLVSGSDDHTLRIWQVTSGECLNVLSGHTNSIFSVAFNSDGKTIASGSADQTVRFWSAPTGRCLKTIKGYTNSIFSIAYTPDGQRIVSGSTDQMIRIWDISPASHQGSYQTLQGHEGWVTSVAIHPQGQLLASTSADQTVRIWSIKTGQCLQVLRGHANWVQSAVFSPNGTQLASAGDDRMIRLWSLNGQLLKTLSGHTSWIWSIRFSPDGAFLASSSDDHTIRVWQVSTGDCVQVLQGHTGQVQSIGFSPDSRMLVSGSGDETVRLWSVSTGDCGRVLNGHQNNVWAVAFSPDGAQVASGSLDQTVRLWDVQTGNCIQTLSVLNHSVRSSIAFNPVSQMRQLATGTHGGTIQIWDLDSGTCLRSLIPNRPYQNTNITGVTGITEAQKSAMKALGAIEI